MASPRLPGPINRGFTNSTAFEDTPSAPGATHVIRYLLRNYNTYAKLERHASLSGEVWSRSRITYEAINEQISQIWSWKDKELPWDKFESYSQGVIQLESVLLSCYFYEPDKPRKLVPDVDDVMGGLDFIAAFFEDKKMLINALNELQKRKFKGLAVNFDDDYDRHRAKDDMTTLIALFTFFENYTGLRDSKIIGRVSSKQQPIADMKAVMRAISQACKIRPPVAVFSEVIIKSLMLISIPCALLDSGRQNAKPLKDNIKTSLRNIRIWEAAKSLINEIFKGTKGPVGLAEIEKQYQILVEQLLNLLPPSVNTAATLLELIKLSTSIRRPFHARSVAFVGILWKLDQELDSNNVAGRHELMEVMLKLTDALQAVQKSVTDVKGIVLENGPYAAHANALNDLLVETEQCSDRLGLKQKWAIKADEFQAAVATDTKHLDMMRKNFADVFF